MKAFRHFAAPVVALCLGVGIVGCSSEPKAEQIPSGARLLVQGDQLLAYTAPRNGDVYVYDATDRTLLYSGKVEKGQTLSVDPEEDKIMLDDRLVLEKDIHAGNRHRIYFQEDRSASGDARVIERSTEIREERTGGERIDRRDDDDTTLRREERRTVETDRDGDVTVKKETTIKSE